MLWKPSITVYLLTTVQSIRYKAQKVRNNVLKQCLVTPLSDPQGFAGNDSNIQTRQICQGCARYKVTPKNVKFLCLEPHAGRTRNHTNSRNDAISMRSPSSNAITECHRVGYNPPFAVSLFEVPTSNLTVSSKSYHCKL